jgi:uncharacterized membrane protein YkvA (DUF1232 family)
MGWDIADHGPVPCAAKGELMHRPPEHPDHVQDADNTQLANLTPNGAMNLEQQATSSGSKPVPGSEEDGSLTAFWETVKRLPRYVRLASALARDPRIPRRSKGILMVGGAYAVSPIDLVPGVIPVAGQVDDLYVLLTALQQAMRMSPKDVVEEHLDETGVTLADIDADLANVRSLVRQGVAWSLRNGGRAVVSMSRNVTAFVNKRRQKGE